MATALNAMESNLAALSSASEPDSYTKSQADAKFEAVDTQLAAKATKSDLTAHIAAVDTQLAAAANLALVDTTKMESELNTTRDELVDTKADLQLATDAVAELKTLFADFKASTDEKMNDLEAQLQERKRKRADQDAKNNIAATAATNDDNGETSVGDNTNINTNTDNDNETSASSAGMIAAITVPLLLVAVIVIGVLVHRNQKLSQNLAPRRGTKRRRASRARPPAQRNIPAFAAFDAAGDAAAIRMVPNASQPELHNVEIGAENSLYGGDSSTYVGVQASRSSADTYGGDSSTYHSASLAAVNALGGYAPIAGAQQTYAGSNNIDDDYDVPEGYPGDRVQQTHRLSGNSDMYEPVIVLQGTLPGDSEPLRGDSEPPRRQTSDV